MPKAKRKVVEAARSLVRARDGHRCQRCGVSIVDRPSALHHRRRKGMGGSALLERASNLIRVCGSGNADGCHGEIHGNPDAANEAGWILYAFQDPSETWVQTFEGIFLLDDFGGRTPCDPPREEAS